MSLGRAAHRAARKHRARLRIAHDQRLNRMHRHRDAGCSRKVRYLSQAAALRHRDSQTAACTAYPCPHCLGWHLTSKGLADG
jgi:hypothetical protein